MNIRDWRKHISNLTDFELKELVNSFSYLLKWAVFKDEYAHYGLEIIYDLLEFELDNRRG